MLMTISDSTKVRLYLFLRKPATLCSHWPQPRLHVFEVLSVFHRGTWPRQNQHSTSKITRNITLTYFGCLRRYVFPRAYESFSYDFPSSLCLVIASDAAPKRLITVSLAPMAHVICL